MCFSAVASFGASAIIGSTAVVAMAKAKTTPQRLFATIPFVFAMQQLAEGMLWLSLKNSALAAWQPFFSYTFLVFALMIWPIWIPITIRMLETDAKRKKILNILLYIGAVIFAVVGWMLLHYSAQVMTTHHHLHYIVDFPPSLKKLVWLFSLLYFMTTIISSFVSGIPRMKWLGIVFLLAYIFAMIFYSGFIVSVWCYFSALLSIVVIWIISGLRKST